VNSKKTHKQLLARQKINKKGTASTRDSDTASVSSSECSICLMSIAVSLWSCFDFALQPTKSMKQPCQSLFVAPCSHVWHYKCIRPILNGHTWPNFLCPNCRAVADLEADVDEEQEVDEADWEEEDGIAEAIEESRRSEEQARANAAAGSSRAGGTAEEPEGLRTPRAMLPVDQNQQNGDEELSTLALHALSLTETTTNNSEQRASDSEDSPTPGDEDDHPTQVDIEDASTSANVPPRDIPTPSASASAGASASGHGSDIRRHELTPGPLSTENVMTPRNDIGPFVLDGGANRQSTGAAGGQRSLDAAASSGAPPAAS